MGYRHSTGQDKTIVNSRSIRKGCDKVILIAFAAVTFAVCISPALASVTYIPPDPTNLTNTTGSDWVNYTWQAGSGRQGDIGTCSGNNSTLEVFDMCNITDSYNVSLNDEWHNGTTNTSMNKTVGSEIGVKIAVRAWNASGAGTLSTGCVSDEIRTQAGPGDTFGLVGSIPTGGGGGGTYPPGWFETPKPIVIVTKVPAAPATVTATDAAPGERVTPTPAPTKMPAAAKATAPAPEGTTAGTAKVDAPGFTAVFVIAGMLVAVYVVMRRRRG